MNSALSPRDPTSPRPTHCVSSDDLRDRFASAMSAMYRDEVPQYATLLEIVEGVNAAVLAASRQGLPTTPARAARLHAERHGAIRVGTARELGTLRRIFAVMGMQPVGYYDLSIAGVPVHSTAFRPVRTSALDMNPFRIFTSLLRLELIEDRALRDVASELLRNRRIFTPHALQLTERFEHAGRFTPDEADSFVREVLQTFRWHATATVSRETYRRMHLAHRLVADVVCFRGPHINHLTPRTLDIDAVQAQMPRHGIKAKEVIEGPPRRDVPILLRQTSFKALEEPIRFLGPCEEIGGHTARFGEVEQRGIALTRKGRQLYDRLLHEASRGGIGKDPQQAQARLAEVFGAFPDDVESIRRQGLGYFDYSVVPGCVAAANKAKNLEDLVRQGIVQATPIVYEDFLPVSAAGIFQSNLGEPSQQSFGSAQARPSFEAALGCEVLDAFELYEAQQASSIQRSLQELQTPGLGG